MRRGRCSFLPEVGRETLLWCIHRYHELIKAAPKGLPIRTDDMTQHEPALGAAKLPPVYVLGAQGDAMIMPHQIRDAADFFGTQAVMLPEIAHDVMLVSQGCRRRPVSACY